MGDKRPKIWRTPKTQKKATAGPVDPKATAREPVSWRMALLDLDGAWGWRKLDRLAVNRLRREIKACEGSTLAQLKHENRAKEIPISDVCPAAQARLPQIGLGDRESIWELRLTHKKWRAWGIIEGATFYFVWWDPDHTVCKGIPQGVRRR